MSDYLSHAAHWGTFSARWDGEHLDIRPHPADPESSPIFGNFTNVLRHRARILKPAVRKSWLEHGPTPGRRRLDDTFVEMEWKDVLPLVANTIGDVRDRCGPPRVPRSSVSSMATMSVAITASSWTGGGMAVTDPGQYGGDMPVLAIKVSSMEKAIPWPTKAIRRAKGLSLTIRLPVGLTENHWPSSKNSQVNGCCCPGQRQPMHSCDRRARG